MMASVSRFGVRFLSAITHQFRSRVQQSRAHTTVTTTYLQDFTSDVPRFGGIATMLRLPLEKDNLLSYDVCFVGIPLDTGTSLRSGTRHGPRQVRNESSILRPYNINGAAPFDSLRVADIGDIAVNPYNLPKAVEDITKAYRMILTDECIPLTLGGDHTITYPILRAVRERHGPVGLVHIDAHSDTHDTMFGEKIAHGTPFRRAVEEGLLDTQRVVQIGLRGGAYTPNDYQWAKEQVYTYIHIVLGSIH